MMSRKMLPHLAGHNIPNAAVRCLEHVSKLPSGVMPRVKQGAYFSYLFGCKSGFAVTLPTGRAPLSCHVPVVAFSGAEKQMVGVTARRVIAGVANKHFVWVSSVYQCVSNAVGPVLSRFNLKHAVPVVVTSCPPFPANSVGFYGNLRPEAGDGLRRKWKGDRIVVSHGLNHPFRLWLGSLKCATTRAGRSAFTGLIIPQEGR